MRAERTKFLNQRQEERIQSLIKQQKDEQEKAAETTERIVKLIGKSKQNLQAGIEFEKQDKAASQRDKICLIVLVLIWVMIMIYSNLPELFHKGDSVAAPVFSGQKHHGEVLDSQDTSSLLYDSAVRVKDNFESKSGDAVTDDDF